MVLNPAHFAMMKSWISTLFLIAMGFLAFGQVDEIKKKSTENSTVTETVRSERTSSGNNVRFLFDFFRLVAGWQQLKLNRAVENKRLISLETYLPGAVQPSSYYLMNPKIRGNWGLFSTDFRFNYLIEEGQGNGAHDLSSFDWQIIQLNLITTKNVIGRIGGGSMQENFGGHNTFFEWTAGLTIIPNHQSIGGSIEYRVAKDYNSNVIPRREVNFYLEKQIFEKRALHGYVTLGGVYQRYYESISVWGMQAGLVIRIF